MTVSGIDLSLRIKKQSGLGVPASGASATEIEVRASQGLQRAVASIQSGILNRSGMRDKQRQGSITATAAYETELRKKNLVDVFAGVLGNTVTAPIVVDNTDLGSAAISGTGTVITFASGSALTEGLRVGMLAKLAGMTVSGNNGVWFPILGVTALTLAVPAGYLTDEAADSTFTLTTARTISTPNPRLKEYFTVEQWIDDISDGLLGTDMRFTGLSVNVQPNAPATVSFTLTGRDVERITAENFTSPVNPAGGMLVMLDGAFYRDGVAMTNLTSLTMGLGSQASLTALLSSRTASDVGMGMFDFTGSFSGEVTDLADFQSSVDEDQVSFMALFGERDQSDIVSMYVGDASFGQVTVPIADGGSIENATIYAGRDQRGDALGYLPSTVVISYTAA